MILRNADPSLVTFDADEIERINTARLAMALCKTQAEIRAMPVRDVADLIEIMRADDLAMRGK